MLLPKEFVVSLSRQIVNRLSPHFFEATDANSEVTVDGGWMGRRQR